MTDASGTPIALLFDQYRYQVGYNDIAPDMIRAIISIEDRRFLEHDGVDWKGTIRAALKNSSSGEVQQGASTLDQQYIKNYYVDTTSSYSGKFKQAIMAIKIDREKPKKEILGDYLNTVYYGRGAYGIEAASQAFFGHPAKEMKPSEAALLAGILPSPSAWDPAENRRLTEDLEIMRRASIFFAGELDPRNR